MKPIVSPEIELQINAAVAQYSKDGKLLWRQWGLAHYRKQGSLVLFHGPPGTGKTVMVKYMALKCKVGLIDLDLAAFGSRVPGENERNIELKFMEAKKEHKGIHMGEADAILWDREKISDNQWMAGVINKLLTEIEVFPNLIFMTTNRFKDLDPALNRRILAIIYLPRPDFNLRVQLWEQKIPKQFPIQLSVLQRQELAALDLTGAEIENAVLLCAGDAITRKKLPTFESLCNVAKMEAIKAKGGIQ